MINFNLLLEIKMLSSITFPVIIALFIHCGFAPQSEKQGISETTPSWSDDSVYTGSYLEHIL